MTPRRDYDMDGLFFDLAKSMPSLPGARCKGRHKLFDVAPDWEDMSTRRYRYDAAKRLCDACPAFTACRAWIEGLPDAERPPGVVAGLLINPRRSKSEIEADREEYDQLMSTDTTTEETA